MEGRKHLALFSDIEPAVNAIDKLRELGIDDREMTIISGVPYSDRMLGRPMTWTLVPKLAITGFLVGMAVGLILNLATPLQYPIHVGGMPLVSIPTSVVLTFEFCMLGLLAFTFLGVIWESAFPSFGPKDYHTEISDGKIAVVFNCPAELHDQAHASLLELGAESMHHTEAVKL
jgi:hypothetical protein